MDLFTSLRIIHRWRWLILSVAIVTGVGIGLRWLLVNPVYEASVKLQLTLPEDENVDLFERYRAITVRDAMTVVRNNFTEVLQSREVQSRTIKQLGLTDEDTNYEVTIRPIRDADFVYVTVGAPDGQLAEKIANAHVSAAIGYYGEVRAQPATAAKHFLADQVRIAEEQLHASEAAFTEFKIRSGIMGLENERMIFQGVLQKLQEERSRQLIEGASNWQINLSESVINQLQIERERAAAQGNTALATQYDQSIAHYNEQLQQLRQATSPTEHIDSIIAKRRDELAQLLTLEPRYTELSGKVDRARKEYELVQSKYDEAVLKENTVKTAGYIQIIEPAIEPTTSAPPKQISLLALALIGSVGLGFMLAFVAEYLSRLFATRPPLTANLTAESPYQSAPVGGQNGFDPQNIRRLREIPLKRPDDSQHLHPYGDERRS